MYKLPNNFQSFIVSDEAIVQYLQLYDNVKDDCEQKVHEPYVVLIQFDNSKIIIDDLLQNQVIRGNLILNTSALSFRFTT